MTMSDPNADYERRLTEEEEEEVAEFGTLSPPYLGKPALPDGWFNSKGERIADLSGRPVPRIPVQAGNGLGTVTLPAAVQVTNSAAVPILTFPPGSLGASLTRFATGRLDRTLDAALVALLGGVWSDG